jgi:Short C-terminal domain
MAQSDGIKRPNCERDQEQAARHVWRGSKRPTSLPTVQISNNTPPQSMPAQAPAPPTPQQPAPDSPDVTEQIRKLAELRDQGILTDEEFQSKKKELLSKL